MKRWYVVHCKPQQDPRAEQHLINQHYDVFRPLVRRRRFQRGKPYHATESMFPGYLFVRLDNVNENWGSIRSTRGVTGLVRWGDYVPAVPEPVIHGLRESLSADGRLDMTAADDFKINERVYVKDGPFAGYEALYQARTGEERVIVLLEIMQRSQRLSVPSASVVRA